MEKIRDQEIPELHIKNKALLKEEVELLNETNLLRGDIGFYGDVLKEQSIDVIISFIKRNSALRDKILTWRKAV